MTNPNTVDDSCLQPERVQLLSDAENAFNDLDGLRVQQLENISVITEMNPYDTYKAELSSDEKELLEELSRILQLLFKDCKMISDAYREAIGIHSQNIDYGEARARTLEQLQGLAERAYHTEYLRSVQEIKRIFPDNLAEVNVPKECKTRVPDIRAWQRKTGIKVAEQADSAYMSLAAEARRGVERDVSSIDDDVYVLQESTLVMPDYQTGETLNDLVSLLIKYKDELVVLSNEVGEPDKSIKQLWSTCKRYSDATKGAIELNNLHKKILESRYGATIDELTSRYVQSIVIANKNEVVDSARRAARGRFISIVEEYLDMLKFSLDNYTAVPGLAATSLKADTKRKRKHRTNDDAERNGDTSKQVREVLFKPGDELFVESDLFPWLGDEIIRLVLMTYRGINCGVAVLDMRTPDVTAIEHKTAGYESEEKRSNLLPVIEEKLQKIARAIADGDLTLSSLKHLKHRNNTDKYPLPISYWGNITSNATRVYVSRLNVANMPESEMKQELSKKNVDELLLFMGACDKQHQEGLLKRFVGDNVHLRN